MSEPFIGQIQVFAFNFAPRGWAKCDGSLMQVSNATALFSLLGTTYGGDGRSTFALPDLRGRVAIHMGTGSGLTNRSLGERSGEENVQLTENNMPAHSHNATLRGSTATPTQLDDTPTNKVLGTGNNYIAGPADTDMGATSITVDSTGSGTAHQNMQPFLTLNWCIALSGVYPSRN